MVAVQFVVWTTSLLTRGLVDNLEHEGTYHLVLLLLLRCMGLGLLTADVIIVIINL